MSPAARFAAPVALVLLAACHHRAGEVAPATAQAGTANQLIGYTWVLHGLGGQPAGIGSEGRQTTLRFGANGTASGFGGCNNYRSTYTVAGDSLHFRPVASTRMACSAGTSQEQNFFLALERVRGWRLTDRHLELLAADGSAIADLDRR